jgi:hypothetical protein
MERFHDGGEGTQALRRWGGRGARLGVWAGLAMLLAQPLARSKPVAAPDDRFGRLPLLFEQQGAEADGAFFCHSPGFGLVLRPTEVRVGFSSAPSTNCRGRGSPADSAIPEAPLTSVRIGLKGASPAAKARGQDPSSTQVNYLVGNDPGQWQVGVPTFGRVRFEAVYPGIDVVYYGTQRQLEYDFVVQPGTCADAICLEFEGGGALRVDADGDLMLDAGGRAVRFKKPVAYQEKDGQRREVPSWYRLDDAVPGRVRFGLGDHDAGLPLVIDPVLAYGTYLGGTGFDRAWSVVVDAAGCAYVAGETYSRDLPVTNAFAPAFSGTVIGSVAPRDAFVAKLGPGGTNLLFATYLGGLGDDVAFDLALDREGNIWLTGATYSSNFPTTLDALQPGLHPTVWYGSEYDAFVTRLGAGGSNLLYSTFLGGSGNDNGLSLAVDPDGQVVVAGFTTYPDFPTVGPVSAYSGGGSDAFVAKLTADGRSLIYSVFLGGVGPDHAENLAVDPAGQPVVVGWTYSSDFPVTNALQPQYLGDGAEGFITKLSADGQSRLFSTFLGGSGDDFIYGVALDTATNVYVTGSTTSTNFPTLSGLSATNSGGSDVFVAKLDAGGTHLIYSTYVGGDTSDEAWGIAVDGSNTAWVAGHTLSTNFPTAQPLQAASGGADDGFLFALDPSGTVLGFSTYLGGGFSDEPLALTLDAAGSAYVVGISYSTNFFPAGSLPAFQSAPAGLGDAFVLKLLAGSARLRVELSGGRLMFQWPTALSGFELQSTDALGDPTRWQTVPEARVVDGDEYHVTLPASGAQNWFRLWR